VKLIINISTKNHRRYFFGAAAVNKHRKNIIFIKKIYLAIFLHLPYLDTRNSM